MNKIIIEDLMQTVKRLNKELDSRIEFEYALMDRINELLQELQSLKFKEIIQ